MSTQALNQMYRKAEESANPWMVSCCWSCRFSDVAYDLSGIVCLRNRKKVCADCVCNAFQASRNNPYRNEKVISFEPIRKAS